MLSISYKPAITVNAVILILYSNLYIPLDKAISHKLYFYSLTLYKLLPKEEKNNENW